MRERPSLSPALGALLGLVTSLPVVALSYLAEQWAGWPFFPFVIFDWLARVLPGGVITLGIDTMVRFIVALGLGPIDVVAKAMEQTVGIVIWLVFSTVIGAVLADWLSRHAGPGQQAGGLAGLVLALFTVVAMLALGTFGANQPWTLLWLAILVPGWGAILGALLERVRVAAPVLAHPLPVVSQPPGGASLEAREQAPDVTAGPVAEPALPILAETPRQVPGDAPAEAPPRAPVVREPAETAQEGTMDRRAFLLRAGGGSVALALLAGGLGRLLASDRARTGAGQPLGELGVNAAPPTTPGTVPSAGGAPALPPATPLPTPVGRIMPAPGTRPEVTPTQDFYRIDIDLRPPEINGSDWQLQVKGLFDRPRNLTLQDLLALPAVTQPITQSCISNPIGGDLISSALYTGPRLVDVLRELGLQPEAKALLLRAADGFYEYVEPQDMMDPRVLLVYGMNGVSLPIEHGYPLRIYIPNRYGMKQPKWITSLEATDSLGSGYWVDRGWSVEARPQVISIIDAVAKDHIVDGRVPVGGIAWAGDRGIRSVEVQVDGSAWEQATLRTPPLSQLVWVQWRYDWPVTPGIHTFRVRATDGKGTVQSGEARDTYPDGATGYHAVTTSF